MPKNADPGIAGDSLPAGRNTRIVAPRNRVAVIVPTFRRPDVLPRALDSVRGQLLAPFEVIVVDDGSGDSTPEVVRAYRSVTLLQQPNAGPAAARNRGLRSVTSTYVASLDHDDEWDPPFLQTAIGALEKLSADVAWVNFRQTGDRSFANYLDTDRRAARLLRTASDGVAAVDPDTAREFFLFTGGAASNSALVLRRESLGQGWDPSAQVADDLLLMARLLLGKRLRYVFLTQPLWTKHEDSVGISRSSEPTVRRCLQDFQAISRIGASCFSPRDSRRWEKKTGNLQYKLAYHCLWNAGPAAAWKEARQAFAKAGITGYAIRLLVIACLRKCARLAGIPPLSQLRRKPAEPGRTTRLDS